MNLAPDSKILHNLFEKRERLRRGDERHREIRLLLFIWSGGTAGAGGAGDTVALNRFELFECFDVVVGMSSGAGIGAYGLCGVRQAVIGSSIFWEECTQPAFISWRRDPMLDAGVIASTLRNGPKRLDLEALQRSRPEFFVSVSEWASGKALLIDAKRALPDPVAAVHASVAMRGAYERPVTVDNGEYADGVCGTPFALDEAVRRFRPTDLLVIANATAGWRTDVDPPLAERVLWQVHPWFRRVPKRIRALTIGRHRRYRTAFRRLEQLNGNGANVGVLWAPFDVHPLCRNAAQLRVLAQMSADRTIELLTKAEKRFLRERSSLNTAP